MEMGVILKKLPFKKTKQFCEVRRLYILCVHILFTNLIDFNPFKITRRRLFPDFRSYGFR